MSVARHPLFATFDNGQSFIAAGQEGRVEACLTALLGLEHGQALLDEKASNDDGFWPAPDDWRALFRPYVVKDGILHIPVKGVLLHDFSFAVGSWATGYVYLQRAFERGCEDFAAGNIKGIAFVCDSPGGMVAGCFDAVDKMYAAKQAAGVPVRGFAHEMAYSACYAVISLADHIAVSRTGGVGSIGVVTSHLDLSGMMEKIGIKRTWIFAGKHKVDGNPDGPLPDDVKARFQARIDELYEVFVSTVARNRPQLSEEKARATEAATFTATQAVSEGLADSIGSLDDAVAAFAADLSSTSGDDEMSNKDNTAAVDQAAVDAAREEGRVAGHAAGLAEGAKAERTRINTILGSDNAKARPKAALSAALKTDMTAEAADAFLADLDEEKPAATTAAPETDAAASFEAAMDATTNPELGADAGKGDKTKDGDVATEVLSLVRSTNLAGFGATQQK